MSASLIPLIQRLLLGWYATSKRDLPWRRTGEPYCIWLSEIMLQQTRVAAAAPYYERFLARFPSAEALSAAPESEVLAAWAGLGYYSRARNLHRAAHAIAARGTFPADYDGIRALPGVGEYTAAAVASIAFGLPHAAVDGNVKRVVARLFRAGDGVRELAQNLLDRTAPGTWNQAVMELGATVCLPRQPACGSCPLAPVCEARARGETNRFPARRTRPGFQRLSKVLLVIQQGKETLLWQRGLESRRMVGFWELPEAEQLPGATVFRELGGFRHTITSHHYEVRVVQARLRKAPPGFRWAGKDELAALPLSTMARKGLRVAGKSSN
ncbi:MAG TPA: A/G-specific adenine glycosylase [Bryobacteraceae bacterium]|nr:A/G-specific adenine glycosylase [Bryobacteraceae bacterium]